MQWLLLVVTFIITALLQRFARGIGSGGPIPVEARATLALGLLVIAAYVGGAIAQRIKLPRIIGYLLAGFVAGPAWLHLIQSDELQVLSGISIAALSLIAFAAGSRLTLENFRGEQCLALLRIALPAMAGPFLVVTLVTLSVSPWFPLTAHQPFRDALVVALVLGAFAAIASPTVTWAVTTDAGARGPLSRSVVNVTIVQTTLAAFFLVVVLAIARPLASGGAVVPGSAARALLQFAGSLAAGAVLGLLMTQYLRVIRVTWVLVGFAFLISQLVRLSGLETVLLGLAAGFTVRNTAPMERERLDVELERCALAVYVVFFALAGAALSFDPLGELGLWPWAILLVALRVNGLRWGLQIAGQRWAEARSAYGWMGSVSQGGLAIALAATVRGAFPEWNVSLEALLVAMVSLQVVLGPICYQWALRRAGELGDTPATREERGEGDVPETALVVGGDNLVGRM